MEFPVPHPTTAIGLKRLAKGRWERINDTLVLNSHHPYSDFIKVEERKIKHNRIRVKLIYTYDDEEYYTPLSVRINNQEEQMIDTKRKRWTYFPLDTVKTLLLVNGFNGNSVGQHDGGGERVPGHMKGKNFGNLTGDTNLF